MERIKTNGSSVLPYVIVGSAIGGTIAYLFASESGRKVRRVLTHPDELAANVEHAGNFIERKAEMVNDRLHNLIDNVKRSIEEGQLVYRDVGQQYRSQVRQIQSKNDTIVAGVHRTIDRMGHTAGNVEGRVLDPVADLGAMVRGIERGIRTLFGKTSGKTTLREPVSIHDPRVFRSQN
jgi:gas vesicle protein